MMTTPTALGNFTQSTPRPRALPSRFRRARSATLIVGCGDVGLRLLTALAGRKLRIVATCRRSEQAHAIRSQGAVALQGDLNEARFRRRLASLTGTGLIWMAPPPTAGQTDPLSRRLRLDVGNPRMRPRVSPAHRTRLRVAYVSTTGVYGDRQGQWTDECTPTRPFNARAIRRVDAENVWRGRSPHGSAPGLFAAVTVLRAPGIYAVDRLPLDRLRAGTPAIQAPEDAWSNHIHADDLARLAWRARFRVSGRRVINTVDHEPMQMGAYFDRVADCFGLPRAPRMPRSQVQAMVSPMMWSFMSESRRLSNTRLRELSIPLRYPTVTAFLDSLRSI